MKKELALTLLLLTPEVFGAQEKPQSNPQTAAETPAFPAGVELVTVDAVVVDKRGQPVTGLTRNDFTVTEDGVPQNVVGFEAVQVPPPASTGAPAERPRISTNVGAKQGADRSFVLIFDDMHLTHGQARRAKIAVAEFLKTAAREGDRVTLVSSSGDSWWTARMAAGRDELIRILNRLAGRLVPEMGNERISEYEAMLIHVIRDQPAEDRVRRRWETFGVTAGDRTKRTGQDPVGDPFVRAKASEVYLDSLTRNRVTLQVMKRVLDAMASTRGRKSLILISQGFIHDTSMDEYKQVVQASRRSNCAIYFLDTRGLGGFPEYMGVEFGPAINENDIGAAFGEQMEAAAGPEDLASDSGGFSVKNTNDLNKGLGRIANESSAYYLLGYNSTNTKPDGRFRKISVKVNQSGVDVRARKGYYAPLAGAGTPENSKKQAPPVDPAFQQAVDSPYELSDIPLRATAYVLEETLLGTARVLVAADVGIKDLAFEQKAGRFLDTLDFLLVVAHRDTGEFYRYDQKAELKLLPETRDKLLQTGFPIVRDFELAPGNYQVKLVVRDKRSGRFGTILHDFAVPDLSLFRISTPILSDNLAPAPKGEKPAAPRVVPAAKTTFAPGSPVFCQFEVYGASKDAATGMPQVTAGYSIRKGDGTPFAQVAPTPIKPTEKGGLSRILGMTLNQATPGDYELILNVKDEISGKTIEERERFKVGGAS